MHARLFSYLDTQLTRLGGPNFDQIPINRPHAPVDDLRRDGFSQQAVHAGRTPYLPNGVGGGCPFLAPAEDGGYEHVPRQVMGPKVRERGPDDPYAQATLFWNSMTPVEQDHIVDAYTFELSKVEVLGVVKRMVRRLVHVHPDLATRVAYGLGLDLTDLPPTAEPDEVRHPDAPDASGGVAESPALAMVTEDVWPPDGRIVQILADDGADLTALMALRDGIVAAGAAVHVVATHKGHITGRRPADQLLVDRSFHTASPAEADAVVVAAGAGLAEEPGAITHLQAAFRHHKPIAAWGDGTELLEAAGIDADEPGVVTSERANKTFAAALVEAMGAHRHWERAPEHPTLHLVDQEA